jgi:SAM-dependent methyltransferase
MSSSPAPYTDAFYAEYVDGMSSSAHAVLGRLYSLYRPTRVVDFGCGRGAWLAAAAELGAASVVGFDGDWIRQEALLDPRIELHTIDFEGQLPRLSPRADLAISVEVAEHVSPRRADAFVEMLCAAADVIVFGGAAPNQGGTSHVNEQPASYWISKFGAQGYDAYDIFRGALWNEPRVEWWYRQNTLLYVRRGMSGLDERALMRAVVPLVDVAHPAMVAAKVHDAEDARPKLTADAVAAHAADYLRARIRKMFASS